MRNINIKKEDFAYGKRKRPKEGYKRYAIKFIWTQDFKSFLNFSNYQIANHLSNSIYLTDYRDELYFSSVPEIIPPIISLNAVGNLDKPIDIKIVKKPTKTGTESLSAMWV